MHLSINMCFTRMLVEMYFLLCVAVKKFGKILWTDRGVLSLYLMDILFLCLKD